MDRTAFSQSPRRAVVGAPAGFRRRQPDETPYAFAIITGQSGGHLGHAIATEEGLFRVAGRYATAGYRYCGPEWEEPDDRERLVEWLRWANPDDGRHYGDFAEEFRVADGLGRLVRGGAFGEDAEDLEEFCTEVLAALRSDPSWLAVADGSRILVGVTSGEDPRDFLRTATRSNDYQAVRRVWAEFRRGEERSARIGPPRSGTV